MLHYLPDNQVNNRKVVEIQTLRLDSISGATYGSKVILKAIETVLKGAAK